MMLFSEFRSKTVDTNLNEKVKLELVNTIKFKGHKIEIYYDESEEYFVSFIDDELLDEFDNVGLAEKMSKEFINQMGK